MCVPLSMPLFLSPIHHSISPWIYRSPPPPSLPLSFTPLPTPSFPPLSSLSPSCLCSYNMQYVVVFCSGLTLRRVVVHADKVFGPGQLGVAISRVRSENDLQVVGFRRAACLRHISVVTQFYTRAQQAVVESGNCSRHTVEGL